MNSAANNTYSVGVHTPTRLGKYIWSPASGWVMAYMSDAQTQAAIRVLSAGGTIESAREAAAKLPPPKSVY